MKWGQEGNGKMKKRNGSPCSRLMFWWFLEKCWRRQPTKYCTLSLYQSSVLALPFFVWSGHNLICLYIPDSSLYISVVPYQYPSYISSRMAFSFFPSCNVFISLSFYPTRLNSITKRNETSADGLAGRGSKHTAEQGSQNTNGKATLYSSTLTTSHE